MEAREARVGMEGTEVRVGILRTGVEGSKCDKNSIINCSIRNHITPSLFLPIYSSSPSPPLIPPHPLPHSPLFSFSEAQIVHLELKKGIVLLICIK